MSVKDGASCPGCGLANYEGLCPHCRGDHDAYEHELVPPFESSLPDCSHCGNTGVEPGTIIIRPGGGSGFNSLDPDPLDRGSYVPCQECHGRWFTKR